MLTDIQIALSDHSLDQSLKDIAQKVLSGHVYWMRNVYICMSMRPWNTSDYYRIVCALKDMEIKHILIVTSC